MSKTATITWVDPTDKITSVEVAMRVATAPNFTVVTNIQPGVQIEVIPALDDGDYEFRLVPVNGTARGPETILKGTAATDAVPGAVTGAKVIFS